MDRVRSAFKRRRSPSPSYERINGDHQVDQALGEHVHKERFSWLEYYIFLLLGISMLWAW